MDKKYLTTSQGIPVGSDLSSVTAGERENGYTLLQDFHLVEKLAHFNRERIPERVVHAKGAGAKGYFEVTNDLSKYTKAKLFSKVGKKTDVFLRFSTVGGEKGSADTASHVRLSSFLDKAGIDMILVDMDSFDDFLSVFHTLTDITERSDLYEKYGEGQKAAIEEIIAKAAGYESKPRVLFVRAGSAFSYVKAKRADDHFAAKIIEDIGAVNIADEYGMLTDSLSLEAVLESNADKILVVPQGDEDASIAYITDLFSQPGWRDVRAIENGSIYFLPKELFHFKPNGRWAEAYEMMEEVLYE